MIRNWLSIVAVGTLSAACADPNPPPAPSIPAPVSMREPVDSVPASTQQSATGTPPGAGPMTFNLPPSAIDVNPPGTPSYVITPGDNLGRRNAQVPRPGGNPAF